MAAYVELPIDGTQNILVEIHNQGLVQAGAGDVIVKASERLDDAIEHVVEMGRQAVQKARNAAQSPDSIQVELGLKLTAKTGFVIAESSGEAHFTVTLKWTLDNA
jgi:Trypsin-co-occurring domain 1